MGCGRRKDIPSMKHMTDIWQPVLSAVQFHKFSLPILFMCTFEPNCDRSVIRTYIKPIANLRRRTSSPDHSLHDTYIAIFDPKIRHERNHSHVFSLLKASLCFFRSIKG